MITSYDILQNINNVKNNIQKAVQKSGRNPTNVNIVAVTKTFPQQSWNIAIKHNLFIFLC